MVKDDVLEIFKLEIDERWITCTVKKSTRARRISLRIISHSEVLLNVPSRGSVSSAKDFLFSKKSWIAKKTLDMPEHFSLGDFLKKFPIVWLDQHKRILSWSISGSRKKTVYQVEGDLIIAIFPENENIDNLLLKFLIKLAGVYLPSRLEQCARKVGVAYEGSRVGNQRSRWGSCSSRKVISLNWRILLLDYLIGEYVLYHELAHLKHMNHSQKYWELLETWIPGAKKLDKSLSLQGKGLMLLGNDK